MLSWLAILFFLAIGIVIGASVSWLVLNSLILESSAALSQIYIGAIAGFGATIAVLLALEIFRLVRDRSAAGSLFNGIANSSEGRQIYIIRMKDEQKSGKYITPIPDYSPSGDSTKYEGRQLTPWVTSTAEAEALKKTMPDADVKQNFHPTYEVFHSASIAKEDARRQLNIEGNTVLFFGFVRPYKGMKYLIDAMPMIIKHIDISLLIVGKFWNEKEEYRKQIEDLGVKENIRMIDRYVPNEEVAIYFSAADVMVCPIRLAPGAELSKSLLDLTNR